MGSFWGFDMIPGIIASQEATVVDPGPGGDFEVRATAINFVDTCAFTCDGDFIVDWGDHDVNQQGEYNASEYVSGVAASPGPIIITNQLGASITHVNFYTDTYSEIDITDGSSLTSLNESFLNLGQMTSFLATNTSNIINFYSAWNQCTGLTSFPLIDTSAGTDFTNTWSGCTSLICLSGVNTLLQNNTTNMFLNCNALVAPTASEQTSILSGYEYINSGNCP